MSKRNVSYYLRNIHFHVPEEHFMDSKKYPIEFHFVHSTKDPNESEYSNLVLGVLGRETFDIQDSSLIKGISLDEGSLSTLIMKPLVGKSYYFYHGSLTTPPYSENVLWFVFKDVINVSSRTNQVYFIMVLGYFTNPSFYFVPDFRFRYFLK